MYLGNNAAIRGCQEYFNRCAAAGSPIGGTQTPTAYDNAASFTSASSQSLTSTAANLQCQSQSFTVAGWFFMPSNAPAYSALITQGSHPVNAGGGFTLQRFDNLNLVYLTIRNDNASNSVAVNSSAFVPSTWNFVECGWDSTLNQSFISLNGGTRAFSTAVAGWTFPNTTNITRLGRDPFGSFLTGNLAGWGLWKRVLTSGTNSEISALFNSGAGRTYAALDSGLRTNLVSWWALNQNSVTADSHGTNTLTNNGTVTAPTLGPVVTALSDPRQLIVDFAQGIDRLGLWNSMVCWPLRSSQNAASGTTAFSLGGLGQFDGALINSPSRGANGMTFLLASAQGISATVGNLTLAEQSLFAVSRTPVINAQQILIARNSTGGSQNGMNLRTNEAAAIAGGIGDIGVVQQVGGSTLLNIINSKDTNFSGYAVASNITNARIKRFPSTESADTALAFTGNLTNTDPLWIGRRAATTGTGDCTIAIASMFTRDIRSSWDQVYALYRQTLGLGLGLP